MSSTSAGGPGPAGASRILRVTAAALLGAAALACGGRGEPGGRPSGAASAPPAARPGPGGAERLSPTWGSPEEAAEAFLDALAADDPDRLEATALTQEEFADVVWPELPSSRPERNLTLDYVWRDLRQKSINALSRVAHRHGGKRYELVRVDFLDETTEYATFRVHREARLTLIDEEGVERRWRLFGSMIERGGRWKLFSFVNDD